MFVIAGATGHVGSVVARELLGRGRKVKVLVHDPAKGAAWSKEGAEVAAGSLDDEAFLAGALRGATAFFTLLPPDYGAADLFASQRRTSDAIAGAVQASEVPYVVMLSSIGAELPAGTGPIKGLHYLEHALRTTGATLTAIRASTFQENVGSSIGPARQAGVYPSFFPLDAPATPMIATRDIGVLAAQLLENKPAASEIVDLAGPAYSPRDVADKLGAALGKTLKIVEVPQPGWIPALVQAGLPEPLAAQIAEMYTAGVAGKLRLGGGRLVQGKTTLDETLKTLTG